MRHEAPRDHPSREGIAAVLPRFVPSSHLQLRRREDFGPRWDSSSEFQWFAFGGTGSAAVQRYLGSVRYRHQMVDAERLTASIAVELVAARAEHRATSRARLDLQEDVAAIFVILDWKAFKERVAGGARGGVELLSHAFNYSLALS